jgi:hypothetical protein
MSNGWEGLRHRQENALKNSEQLERKKKKKKAFKEKKRRELRHTALDTTHSSAVAKQSADTAFDRTVPTRTPKRKRCFTPHSRTLRDIEHRLNSASSWSAPIF